MPSPFAHHWLLDPEIALLNHGSFGATPRAVLEVQTAWRDRMEREPIAFFVRDLEPALDAARAELGAFLHADPDDLAFVPNATTAFNTVLASLHLEPGDELLVTDHGYNAAKNALQHLAERDGGRVVIAPLPFPIRDPHEAVAAILACVTPRTRVAVIDHVTSPTALILPIAEIVAALADRGVDTLVDGAHAPGMLDLDVPAIGAAWYAGNLHKWVHAPKGSAFLWVAAGRQAAIRPLVISHGANSPRTDRSRFRLEFDWTGTDDQTAYLAVPAALRFGASLLAGGWPALRRRNHDLAIAARDLVLLALDQAAPAPDSMIGSMVTLQLPPTMAAGGRVQGVDLYGDSVHDALLEVGLQTMITPWPQRPDGGPWRRLLRVSAAAHNDLGQMERLAAALPAILAGLR
ncbi:MAG: aminotransferase class V-fold PLP-dependent enzyme [Chloroflexota bacterium]